MKQERDTILRQDTHCPEVEELMGGRLPFVTRHGITIVVLVLLIVCIAMILLGLMPTHMIKDIIDQTINKTGVIP